MAFGLFKKKTFADTAYINGKLHTLDPETEGACAIACREGRIMRIGSDEDIKAVTGPDTAVTDLRGRYLTPGFIDLFGRLSDGAAGDSCIELRADMTAEEAAAEAEALHSKNPGADFILACGWFSKEEEIPAIDGACPDIPVIFIAPDGVSMRLNAKAQAAVKERAESELFRVNLTPSFVFDTVVSADYEEAGMQALERCEEYASRGYTSVLNLGSYPDLENIFRDVLLEFFHAGIIKQRYFGSLPVKSDLPPMTVMFQLNRKRTACSELQGLINFNTLHITAASQDAQAPCMSAELLKPVCEEAADKGFSIRIDALDRQAALKALELCGHLSETYRRPSFSVVHGEEIEEAERADLFTGSAAELPADPASRPFAGGEDMLLSLTERAAAILGAPELGGLSEGKAADFAVFSVDPLSLSTAEEFEALRADMTVLGGLPVYDASSGKGWRDWYGSFRKSLEDTISELGEEESEEEE